VEGPAPFQGPDANGFITGHFGRWSLEHGRRQFRGAAGKPWKNLARQTAPLAIKYKYQHCPSSMLVFDIFS
jgi:hypothetical protein